MTEEDYDLTEQEQAECEEWWNSLPPEEQKKALIVWEIMGIWFSQHPDGVV